MNKEEFRIFYRSETGRSHSEKNMPCEDHSLAVAEEGYIFLAVSDGHGDPACFRASKGSELACKAARAKIASLFDPETQSLKGKINEIGPSLIDQWRKYVDEDIALNPYSDIVSEAVASKGKDPEEAEAGLRNHYGSLNIPANNHYQPYGATLRVAVITKKYLYIFQLGDGGTFIFYSLGKGQPAEEIVDEVLEEAKKRQGGNVTLSLCDHNARGEILCYQEEIKEGVNEVLGVFLSSDGLTDASRYKTFGKGLSPTADIQEKMLEATTIPSEAEQSQKTAEWIKALSQDDSYSDDVSLAFCIFQEKVKAYAPNLEAIIKMENDFGYFQKAKKEWYENFEARRRYYEMYGSKLKAVAEKTDKVTDSNKEAVETAINKFEDRDQKLGGLFQKFEEMIDALPEDLSTTSHQKEYEEAIKYADIFRKQRDEYRPIDEALKAKLEEFLKAKEAETSKEETKPVEGENLAETPTDSIPVEEAKPEEAAGEKADTPAEEPTSEVAPAKDSTASTEEKPAEEKEPAPTPTPEAPSKEEKEDNVDDSPAVLIEEPSEAKKD